MARIACPQQTLPPFSPLRDWSINALLSTLQSNYKKKSKATVALTLQEAKKMLHAFPHTVRGRFHELCIAFPLLGMLRQRAAKSLIIFYEIRGNQIHTLPESDVQIHVDARGKRFLRIRVDSDKNLKLGRERFGYVPEYIATLDYSLLRRLEEYLLIAQPPSGSFLLCAPKADKPAPKFFSNAFTGFARIWRDTFKRLFPSEHDRLVASHSGRKTLAEALWNDGWCRRVIADAGGWFLKRDAVDLYFQTDPTTILYALEHLGERLGLSRLGAPPQAV